MSKKWERIKPEDVKVGDLVRVTSNYKDLDKKSMVETTVTEVDEDDHSFLLGAFETWEFPDEFSKGSGNKLYRKVKPFVWPKKFGAVVTGEYQNETVYMVLTQVVAPDAGEDAVPVFYSPTWGYELNQYDLEYVHNFKLVREGVDTD